MRCSKCNTNNYMSARFCYNCGENLLKNKGIKNNFLYNNIPVKRKFSLKYFTYKHIIFSENKYRNIFILLAIIVLCSAFSVPLCKGLLKSFYLAMYFVNNTVESLSYEVLKDQAELYFRDVFIRFTLLLVSFSSIIFSIVSLIYACILKKH